jgi:two-component system phosphate regulon sensor histidine kinase PhoR
LKACEEGNRQLIEQLKTVERERIEYLQNVSHQLVAPLNAIKWHIENINEGRMGIDRAKKVLKSIYSQATIAVHLAKNFNLMSNLEADHALSQLKEPLRDIDLKRLLINLANDFQPLAWDQEIDIGVSDSRFDGGPSILAMRPLISQVFSNIIENAVKYADPKTKIIIEGFYKKEDDSFAVRIRNRGIPLPEKHQEDVFVRGFRTPEAKRKYPAGTGFGLYIARRIVEIHEGTLTARSADGWTVFEVTLTVKGLQGKARYVSEQDRTPHR